MINTHIVLPHQTPHAHPRPCRRPGRGEDGFALILTLVFLILLSLLGVLALNTSDFENMVAVNAQQAEVNFSVAEGGNALEACNVGFVKRDWFRLTDPEKSEWPMVPTAGHGYNPDTAYNPGDRKKPSFYGSGGTKYALADFEEKEAPEQQWMWPFGNVRVPDDDGQVSLKEEDYAGGEAYDYRYLVTYIAYDNIRDAGTSQEVDAGFGTYTFRIQTSPVTQGEEVTDEDGREVFSVTSKGTLTVSQGGVVETAGLKYGQKQTL